MNDKLDLNDLLIFENELKIMLSISTNTKLHYSEISKERYDFAESLYLHKNAKIRDIKNGTLSGQLTYHLLNKIDNLWINRSSNSIAENAIREFKLKSTPEISKVLVNIVEMLKEIGHNSTVILMLSILAKRNER